MVILFTQRTTLAKFNVWTFLTAKVTNYAIHHPLKTMTTINILAISDKGKSRIGKKLTLAIVEQNHHDKMFIVIPGTSQCRWIQKDNDPDFRIIRDN